MNRKKFLADVVVDPHILARNMIGEVENLKNNGIVK
jgi:hypothetical protein